MKKFLMMTLTVLILIPSNIFCSTSKNNFDNYLSPEAQQQITKVAGAIGKAVYNAVEFGIKSAVNTYQNNTRTTRSSSSIPSSLKFGSNNSDDESDWNDSDNDSDADSDTVILGATSTERKSFFRTKEQLQYQLDEDHAATTLKLAQAITSLYEGQTPPQTSSIQEELAHIILLAQKVKHTETEGILTLDEITAGKFNKLQSQILQAALVEHAKKIEPTIINKYQKTIDELTQKRKIALERIEAKFTRGTNKANKQKEQNLTKQRTRLELIAQVSIYLNERSKIKIENPAHNLDNFATNEAYQTFLESQRNLKD